MIDENDPLHSKPTDPFADLAKLRMSQDFADNLSVEKILSKISVGKPNKQVYFRVHSDPSYRLETAVIRSADKNETYLVDRGLWDRVSNEIVRVVLFTAITRQRSLFIWPIQLPGPDGKHHDAHRVQLETALHAMQEWTRLTWVQESHEYDVKSATADLGLPKWPDATFQEYLKIAFKERFISSWDHPVLRELRGEV